MRANSQDYTKNRGIILYMPPEQIHQPQPEPFNFFETSAKKNFAPWFIKFIVILIATGLGAIGALWQFSYDNYQFGLKALEKSEEQIESIKQARTSTENWQTYRNEEYGFEFKYPPGVLRPVQIEENGLEGAEEIKFNYYGEMYDDYQTSFKIWITEYINQSKPTSTLAYFISPDKKYIVMIFQGQIPLPQGIVDQILSTFKFVESYVTTTGMIVGKVTIGPNCPVEQEGIPCPTPPEAYAAREFLILNSDKKQVANFRANAEGNFNVVLPPGTYTITSAKMGIGFMSGDLPKTITIKPGQTITFNIDIDTGIR